MAYITSFQYINTAEFTLATSDANAAAVGSAIFTNDAHLQWAWPNHDYISRETWEKHTVQMYLQDGSGNATINAFKARVFISLDGKVWQKWVEMTGPNYSVIDAPFRFIKVVRDNATAGTVKAVIYSQLTHTA